MSTKKNSPDTSTEWPDPVSGRNFVPVGRVVDNDHEARKTAHPSHPMTDVVHGTHPYTYAPAHGRNHSFKTKGSKR
jgi:hypothetical protein